MRGGGWTLYDPNNAEASTRQAIGRSESLEALGFRCARSEPAAR
jgi:hypothetical protein